jgi:chitodextrinase
MVRLKVVDNNGADSSAYVTAVISDNPPTSLPGNDTGATVGKPVWLNGAGSYDPDGRIVKYDWSLGDGTAEQGATVMHVYDRPDKYTVTLTVTDDGGLNATASMTVNVAEAEAAPPADPGGLQGMTLLAGAGITCVALILTMRKKTK